MINLETFFKNHFDTDKISDDNMNKFTEIHLQRLVAANTSGQYSAMIAATSDVYKTYFGSMTSEDVNFAVQQSLTKSKDVVFAEFKKTVSQKEGTIRGIWDRDTPIYQEFFPLGLTEYSDSTMANVEMLMTRMVEASTAHVDELGQPFVDIFVNLKSNFIAARTTQLEKIGTVKDQKAGTRTNRDELEVQLMNNLLIIASQHIGQPEMLTVFFDQSFIRPSASEEDEDGNGGNGNGGGDTSP